MNIEHQDKFIRRVERLINPMAVSDLLFLQKLKGLLPPAIMKRLLYRASKNTPHIGFVIEPYSLFLFFKLRDLDYARSLLPESYELSKTRLFADEEPDYYMGIGNLGTRASTFWGTRQEWYLIATDKRTGLLSFIFIDILSNTLIAEPDRGIANPNCTTALFTTSSHGEVFLEIEKKKSDRKFSLTGSIKNGRLRKLDQTLWVMGNTSIGHSKDLVKGEDQPFAVVFDPAEVAEALDIPPGDITIGENTFFPGLAEQEIARVICFPYAQHYIADSPGCSTYVKDPDDLVRKYNAMALAEEFATFSGKTIIRQLLTGIAVGTAVVILLLLLF